MKGGSSLSRFVRNPNAIERAPERKRVTSQSSGAAPLPWDPEVPFEVTVEKTIKSKPMSAIAKSKLSSLTKKVVSELGLPSVVADRVMYIFAFECPKFVKNGEQYYTIEMEYPYRGLGQFADKTWNAINKLYPNVLDVDSNFVGNPVADIRATIGLMMDSARYHKNVFGETLTDEKIFYLYHQQGAPAAASYLRSGKIVSPRQSKASMDMFKEIKRGNYI